MAKAKAKKFRVLQGFNVGTARHEIHDIVTEEEVGRSSKWLIDQQVIEPVETGKDGRALPITDEDRERAAEVQPEETATIIRKGRNTKTVEGGAS